MKQRNTVCITILMFASLILTTCNPTLSADNITPAPIPTPAPMPTSTPIPTSIPAATSTLTPSRYSIDNPPAVSSEIQSAVTDALDQHEQIKLFYYGDSEGLGPTLDIELAKKFSDENSKEGKTIEVVVVPPVPALERRSEYERLFQAQSTDIDVMMLDVIWSSAFMPHLNTTVFTIDDLDQHEKASAQNSKVDDQVVALPWFRDFGVLYYRSDLLQKYMHTNKPPTDWKTLEQMAKTIQAGEWQDGKSSFWGFVWQGKAYEGLTCDALEWIYSYRKKPTTAEEKQEQENALVQVDTQEAKDALQQARNWIWAPNSISPPDVLNFTEPDATKVFTSSNAAFMRGWPTAIKALNSEKSLAGKYEVAPLPSSDGQHSVSIVGGQQLGVSKKSKNPNAAAAFVRYMTSPEVQFWRAVVGAYMPTIDPKKKPYPEELQTEELFIKFKEDEIKTPPSGQKEAWDPLGKFKAVDFVARPTNATGANYDAFSAAFYSGVNYFLSHKEQDIDQFARRLNERIQRVIKDS